jgi:hypothetical protein
MRTAFTLSVLVLPLIVTGCGPEAPVAAGAVALAGAGSVLLFQRTPIDMAVSVVTGRDCSVVHLDRREGYCRPKELAPETPVFCTRSLGVPDCWEEPSKVPNHPRELADGPRALTPAQESARTSRWLGL